MLCITILVVYFPIVAEHCIIFVCAQMISPTSSEYSISAPKCTGHVPRRLSISPFNQLHPWTDWCCTPQVPRQYIIRIPLLLQNQRFPSDNDQLVK